MGETSPKAAAAAAFAKGDSLSGLTVLVDSPVVSRRAASCLREFFVVGAGAVGASRFLVVREKLSSMSHILSLCVRVLGLLSRRVLVWSWVRKNTNARNSWRISCHVRWSAHSERMVVKFGIPPEICDVSEAACYLSGLL